MKEEDIYKLKLNEHLLLNDNTSVIRVPGGWIYKHYQIIYNDSNPSGKRIPISSNFVPFNDEFQSTKN